MSPFGGDSCYFNGETYLFFEVFRKITRSNFVIKTKHWYIQVENGKLCRSGLIKTLQLIPVGKENDWWKILHQHRCFSWIHFIVLCIHFCIPWLVFLSYFGLSVAFLFYSYAFLWHKYIILQCLMFGRINKYNVHTMCA